MKSTDPAPARALDRNAFLILLALLTVALAAIIWPFYGAVFWGAVLALLFEPLYRKLAARLRNRRTLAALVTLSVILVMVILPLTLVAISLVQELTAHVPARQERARSTSAPISRRSSPPCRRGPAGCSSAWASTTSPACRPS